MKKGSKALSIIAYYLSEYDMRAVEELGYKSRRQAFIKISEIFGRKSNYLKLRRDEFDALSDSRSKRLGWRNRRPAKDVVESAAWLKQFSFEEMTNLVLTIIDNCTNGYSVDDNILPIENRQYTENEIENIINFEDDSATIKVQLANKKVRTYNTNIIKELKDLYKGECQICGSRPFDSFGANICEAHHIVPFAESKNNNSKNIIILCPNHHRLIHKLTPTFDREKLRFIYRSGKIEHIKKNYHL